MATLIPVTIYGSLHFLTEETARALVSELNTEIGIGREEAEAAMRVGDTSRGSAAYKSNAAAVSLRAELLALLDDGRKAAAAHRAGLQKARDLITRWHSAGMITGPLPWAR